MKKIALLSICVGALRNICCTTTQNFRHYCEIHGYDCVIKTAQTSNRPASWEKISFCQELLPYYDWLFWIDSDACILNMSKKLEDLIDDNYDIIIAENIYGINAGVWLIKNSPWSAKALKEVWELMDTFYYTGTWEQAPMQFVIKKDQRHTKLVPQRAINAQLYKYWKHALPRGEYQPGDFILHFPGISNAVRGKLIFDYLDTYYTNLSKNINQHLCRNNKKIELSAIKKTNRKLILEEPQCTKNREMPKRGGLGRQGFIRQQNRELLCKMVNSSHATPQAAGLD
jgi:hypothetical protein